MILTADQFKEIVPGIRQNAVDTFMPHLTKFMPLYQIDTPQRIGAFIAQTAEESMNYSQMRELASGQEYEGREDLGNISPGDGVKFKGRGVIQITGRSEYKACSLALFGDELLLQTPDLLTTPQYAVQSACWFWRDYKNLNEICDKPEDWHMPGEHNYTKFQWLTVKINGGLNGIAVRLANYQRARQVLHF